MARVLIVDDERGMRVTLREFLLDEGHDVEVAEDADAALQHIEEKSFDVVISDIVLPRTSGVELMQQIRDIDGQVQVILITGEPTVDSAVKAVRMGAYDYLSKPISGEAICRVVANAAHVKRLNDENKKLYQELLKHKENLEELVEQRTAQMRASERKYRTLVENAQAVIVTLDGEGRFTFMNSMAAKWVGGTPEEFLGKSLWDVFPKAVADRHYSGVKHVMAQREGYVTESRTVLRGEERWFRTSIQPLENEHAEIVGALVITVDIDEQVRALSRLEESEKRYRELTDMLPVAVSEMDENGTFTYLNRVNPDISFGYTQEDIKKGITAFDMVVPEEHDMLRAYITRMQKGEAFAGHEYTFKTKNGDIRNTITYSNPIREASGRVCGARVVVVDITDRKKAEDRLRESEETYRNLTELSSDGICIVRDEGFVYANQRLAEMLRVDPKELLGHSFAEYIHPDDLTTLVDWHKRHFAGERDMGILSVRIVDRDGKVTNIEINASMIRYKGKPAQLVSVREAR